MLTTAWPPNWARMDAILWDIIADIGFSKRMSE